MRCLHVIFIGLIFLLVGASAKAEELSGDGNELLRDCEESLHGKLVADAIRAGTCLGYLSGIVDMHVVYAQSGIPNLPISCIPPGGVSLRQVQRVVVKYLQEHPEELHYKRFTLVNIALLHAFPCKVQPAPQ
jgi:hypothetical protein